MDIGYLREFCVLAEVCNYYKAAELLYISHSSLFGHIKQLENEFGVPLFERNGKNIVLSENGTLLLSYAKTIVTAMDDFEKALKHKKELAKKTVRIGTDYSLTAIISEFCHVNPGYYVDLHHAPDIEDAFEKDGCEIVLLCDPDENTIQRYEPIFSFEDQYVVAVCKGNPLEQRERIQLKELKDERLILPSSRGGRKSNELMICEKAGFVPNVVMSAFNGTEIKQYISKGVGISILLRSTFTANELKKISLIELDPPEMYRFVFVTRKNAKLSEAALRFLAFLKENS